MVAPGPSESHADTRTYRVVHTAFRLMTTRLVDATEKLEPSVLQTVIEPHWSFYAGVLHHHHHNEDDSVFPALLAVRPDMGALITTLEDDHQQLIGAMEAVDAAISSFEDHPDAAHQGPLLDAIVAVREMFFPHLDIEDQQILSAIAESIPPNEWDRMDKEALKSIPKEYLPTAVGAIDEVVQETPEEERPPSPPVPIRLMLTLSWRKKWSARVEPLLV
jgi:hemerythrin-like domain-containing protein